MKRQFFIPGLIPIRLTIKLINAGLSTWRDLRDHIEAGTLQTLRGIGPKTEEKILRIFTEMVEIEED